MLISSQISKFTLQIHHKHLLHSIITELPLIHYKTKYVHKQSKTVYKKNKTLKFNSCKRWCSSVTFKYWTVCIRDGNFHHWTVVGCSWPTHGCAWSEVNPMTFCVLNSKSGEQTANLTHWQKMFVRLLHNTCCDTLHTDFTILHCELWTVQTMRTVKAFVWN